MMAGAGRACGRSGSRWCNSSADG